MKTEWKIQQLSNIVEFNPKETLKKGVIAKKISMDKLQPFCRDICEYELTKFTGGTKFRNGDTIMARITPCLENGKTAKINILNNGEIGFGSTEYIVFRAKEGISDPDFIYYLVTSSLIREPAIKSMVGSSGRQRVQSDVVEKIKINLPPLPVQKKIAAILSSFDNKIELNKQINNNLEQQIKTICTAWLSNYAPFGGTLPDDWSKMPLSTIANFIGGYSYKGDELTESNIAMATIKNFDRKGGFKLDGYKEIIPSNKLKDTQHADLFDTLVAHTDLTQNADVIGNAVPVMSKSKYDDIVFSMDVVKVIPKNKYISKFLIAAILQDKKFKAHCLGYVNGTTVLHLSKNALSEYQLYLPDDLAVLKPLDELVTTLYQQIATNIEEIAELESLRDTLLPRLMSGELDVTGIDL